MASEIIKLYTSSLSSFFTLSDAALADARKDKEPTIPPFVPAGATVFCSAHYAETLLDELAECVAELNVVDIGGEAANGLKGLVENMRWRMLEVVTASWAKGASPSDVAAMTVKGVLTGRCQGAAPSRKLGCHGDRSHGVSSHSGALPRSDSEPYEEGCRTASGKGTAVERIQAKTQG